MKAPGLVTCDLCEMGLDIHPPMVLCIGGRRSVVCDECAEWWATFDIGTDPEDEAYDAWREDPAWTIAH